MGHFQMEWDPQTDGFGGEPEVWADETEGFCKQTTGFCDWRNAARGCGALDPERPGSAFLPAMISEKDRAAGGNEPAIEQAAPTRRDPAAGRFIVLEGIDGAGTTSQRERLLAWLSGRGIKAHATAEPSTGPIGKLIRSFLSAAAAPLEPRAMALLFAADRRDHLQREILPLVAQGTVVLCDRYVLSSLAYQTVAGVPREVVAQANAEIRRPDLTLFFSLPVAVAAQRRAERASEVEIYDADSFQGRVAAAYEREAKALRDAGEPIAFIDAGGTREQVEAALRAALTPLLP